MAAAPDRPPGKGGARVRPDPARRAALLALSADEAAALLDADDPQALALAEEFVLAYSARAGECLKDGGDYLDMLSPGPETPALEVMAMEAVLEALEAELERE
jgi:hypothetical protein